ncbi:MAG: hypothetical protein A2W25_04800 [candidate division Zixibacteria bacterium RBG_16_53_22]|nr:MAG: hypothetical protein A2W25_04800 [candidate division Zixibacteria bacterium RBG_16_53_22]
MKCLRAALVFVFAILLHGCSRTTDNNLGDQRIILQVGTSELSLGDLNRQTQGAAFTDARQEFETKKTYVEQYLERYLLIEGAKEAGLTAELDSTAIRRSLIKTFKAEMLDKVPKATDWDALEFYGRYGGEIQAGHLLIKSQRLADSLYESLSKGADFVELVRRFSEDEMTTETGGTLGYFRYGRFVDKFEDAAFTLRIGEYSKPVLTRFGWHIIKLYDRKNNTPEDFEKNKGMYRGLLHRKNEIAANEQFYEQLKNKYHYRIIQPTLDLLAHKADSAMALGMKPEGLPSSAYLDISLFTDVEKNSDVVEYDGGDLKIIDILGHLRRFAPERAPDLREFTIMEDFLEEVSMPILTEKMALEDGFDKNPRFLSELEYLRGTSLLQKMQNAIYSSIDQITEEDIAKYYDEHKDEFYFPDVIRASGIAVKTGQEADALLQRIRNGAVFRELAMKYSVDKMTGVNGGDLNYFSVKLYTPVYQAAESLRIGSVGGPVEFDGNWWIFKLTERMARKHKELDLVRAEIRSRLYGDRRNKAYDEFISRMKEKIPNKMDLELVKDNLRMGKYQEEGESKG